MKIRNLDLEASENDSHRQLGLPPLEQAVTHPGTHPVLRLAVGFVMATLLAISLYLVSRLFLQNDLAGALQAVLETLTGYSFWAAVLVGFAAQAVDGALGMAYGITATTFLLGTGVTPAIATASVHMAEVFTTGFSGVSHVRYGNVNKSLFLKLLVPGIVGALLGVVLVTQIDGAILKPYISAYLLLMGLFILSKAFRRLRRAAHEPRHVAKLAVCGGFVDTVGGGGWGPVVTTTLIGSGHDPRTTIGSVNFAEFFLSLSSAAAFAVLVGPDTWPTIAGLVLGGVFAAPLAAVLTRKLSPRTLLVLVGILISTLSVYNLYRALLA
ncbi:MAG: sulfite exporter TauE/SafE family protein [Pseudomonadota bacterium]|nr:sulfite exporter TauE/SafE family protein [Pseudomonadota bacterium]